jgi:leucyl-tRNA synthetase
MSPVVVRKLHQTIRKVTADTESLDYNTAIAAMMEYVNEVRSAECRVRSAVEPLVILLAPYAPHLAEELWETFGNKTSVFQARWPSHDERLAAEDEVEIAVQVNGKVRARFTVPRGASQEAVVGRAMEEEGVKKFVDGQKVKKVVYVQDRLVNLVV